jgi:hypothetical protein
MGASGYGSRIELIVNISEFFKRVGLICDYQEFEWLGLQRGISLTSFPPHLVEQLLNLCAQDPTYHIVSGTAPGRLVNKYVPNALSYQPANGDKNPDLVLNAFVDPKRALVDEEMMCSALAILHHVDAGDQ